MSQPSSHIPTPLATAVLDWLVVPDSAIQSDGDDNEAVAKAEYNERQHWKKEAAAWERAENEHQEREAAELHRQEEAECWEREENKCWEREVDKHWEWEVLAWAASQVKGTGSQSHDSVHWQKGHKVRGATSRSHDLCLEQCVPASTKKVWKCVVAEESTSPRASEKKKHVRAKSLEVEISEDQEWLGDEGQERPEIESQLVVLA
ncbi:hypothetical protein EDD17DRAFT_1513221 [Pisolithus thermaeus]|nr:hypothetical protein EV401DRAFT_1893117 [Pisolithus croceorrhizus]KAI6152791.1 hypothetical protein EDD17DRAFT_1513221 [Pisolithus thermaeus]